MTLLKKTRIWIIVLVMAVIMLLFTFIIVALNLFSTRHSYSEAWHFLDSMAGNGGFPVSSSQRDRKYEFFNAHMFAKPDSVQDEQGGEIQAEGGSSSADKSLSANKSVDYVSAGNLEVRSAMSFKTDVNLNKISVVFSINVLESLGKMFELCRNIVTTKKTRGILNGYFYVVKAVHGNTFIVCVMNRYIELRALKRLYIYSAVALAVAFVYSFATSFVFSKIIMQPIEDMFESQKQFISDSSHELRTPISVIDANLSVVMSEYPGNKWLGYIKDENERMGKLVKSMLYLARREQKLAVPEMKEFDFSAAVTTAVLPFESVVYEARKRLDMDIEPGLKVTGDESAVKQVVTILVDNAVKYSSERGFVRIRAFHDGRDVCLKVYNTGKGIKKENLENVFDRFFREDKTRTGLKRGYGLGLSIARSIIDQHEGSISADSDGETWVEFTVLLR